MEMWPASIVIMVAIAHMCVGNRCQLPSQVSQHYEYGNDATQHTVLGVPFNLFTGVPMGNLS